MPQKTEVYHIKACLSDWNGNTKGKPYRIIAIPSNQKLYDLAEGVTSSFEFYFDHCFGFYDNIKRWVDAKEGYELFSDIGEESRFPGVKKTKIKKVFDVVGKKI